MNKVMYPPTSRFGLSYVCCHELTANWLIAQSHNTVHSMYWGLNGPIRQHKRSIGNRLHTWHTFSWNTLPAQMFDFYHLHLHNGIFSHVHMYRCTCAWRLVYYTQCSEIQAKTSSFSNDCLKCSTQYHLLVCYAELGSCTYRKWNMSSSRDKSIHTLILILMWPLVC